MVNVNSTSAADFHVPEMSMMQMTEMYNKTAGNAQIQYQGAAVTLFSKLTDKEDEFLKTQTQTAQSNATASNWLQGLSIASMVIGLVALPLGAFAPALIGAAAAPEIGVQGACSAASGLAGGATAGAQLAQAPLQQESTLVQAANQNITGRNTSLAHVMTEVGKAESNAGEALSEVINSTGQSSILKRR